MSQATQLDEYMPSYGTKKRGRASSSSSGFRKRSKSSSGRIPRALAFKRPGQTAICPLIYDHDLLLTTDPNVAVQFTPNRILINGTASTLPGSAELANVWELMRVQKVEITILPYVTDLGYNNQSLSSGITNIPFVYEAIDYNDPEGSTGLTQIRQNPTTKTHLLNKVIRRTVYPKLRTSKEVIDCSVNNPNLFVNGALINTDTRWNGWMFVADMVNEVWTYGSVRISFKVFVECMKSK